MKATDVLSDGDSMNSDELEMIERSILEREGPTLGQVHFPKNQKSFAYMTSTSFMKSLPERGGKEVKYIGNTEDSAFRAYYYLLLHIEMEQRRSYPHLRNIIREQLSKDYILRKQQEDEELLQKSKQKRINPYQKKTRKDSRDNICEMYFEIIHNCTRIQDFIMRNHKFDSICLNMIYNLTNNKNRYFPTTEQEERQQQNAPNRKSNSNSNNSKSCSRSKKSLKTSNVFKNLGQEYKFLCKVFNIDFQILNEDRSSYSAYRLGTSRRFFIVFESGYVFVVMIGLQMTSSGRKNSNHDSQIVSNASTPLLPQVVQLSQESTPKFIEGHESSIRYRKKSHKNSFGGDIDIISYKDLNASLHQLKDTKKQKQIERYIELQKKNNEKVFSERFEAQEMGPLQIQDPIGKDDQDKKRRTSHGKDLQQSQLIPNDKSTKKNNVTRRPMRKSHCQTQMKTFQSFLEERGKKLEQSKESQKSLIGSRKKKMSSSACLQQEQTDKLPTIFNNKISFSKHDRTKFALPDQQSDDAPERQATQMVDSNYTQSISLHNNIISMRNQFIANNPNNKHAANSKSMQFVMMGKVQKIYDSKIEELPYQEIQKSNKSSYQQRESGKGCDTINASEHTSQKIIDMLQPGVRDKFQNRKYSQFTEKYVKSPSQKEVNFLLNKSASKPKVNMVSIPEKEEQGVISDTPKRRKPSNKLQQRFQQTPLHLSELEGSLSSAQRYPFQSKLNQTRNLKRLKIMKGVTQFMYDCCIEPQPENWVRKEVTYFFTHRTPQTRLFVHRRASKDQLNTSPYFKSFNRSIKNMKKSQNQYQSNGKMSTNYEKSRKFSYLSRGDGRSNQILSSEAQKRSNKYPSVMNSNIQMVDHNRKNSVSYSVYSRKAAVDERMNPLQQQIYNKPTAVPTTGYNLAEQNRNNAMKTSLSGGHISVKRDSPESNQGNSNQGNRSGRQKSIEHALMYRDSRQNPEQYAIMQNSKPTSPPQTIPTIQNKNVVSYKLPTNYRPFTQNYQNFQNRLHTSPHLNPNPTNPLSFKNTQQQQQNYPYQNKQQNYAPEKIYPHTSPYIPRDYPTYNLNNAPTNYYTSTNNVTSPTNLMRNSDPSQMQHHTEPQQIVSSELQYSTSMERFQNPYHSPKNVFRHYYPQQQKKDSNFANSNASSLQHHQNAVSSTAYQLPAYNPPNKFIYEYRKNSIGGSSREGVKRDSPDYANNQNNTSLMSQPNMLSRHRPPSNTGTMSSRTNIVTQTSINYPQYRA